jgi:competence protein ComEA
MKSEINFNLSKRSRRGVIILGMLTLTVIYLPRFYFFIANKEKISIKSFPSKQWISDHKSFKKKIFYSDKKYARNFKTKFSCPPKRFDPNEYSKNDWMNLGLSEKQTNVVLKFTMRGINSNEDLKKIFVISDQLFQKIKDSTFYPKRNEYLYSKINKEKFQETKKISIDINLASEEQLLELKGIGQFFATQIIKRRNELGGFTSKNQLLEVWKMDEAKLEIFKDQINIDLEHIHKINLNTISVEELKVHPYIRWNIANSIIKMRNQKNGFKKIEEIKESVLISEELFEKLKPYLSL